MKNLVLVENEHKPLQATMEKAMTDAMKHFESELLKIRTTRAHTSLIEDIMVLCYGSSTMPLKQLASLAAPDARLLTIQPWDMGVLNDIEKAILESDIGITPINDGKTIKLVLPEMSSTRREELTKMLGKRLEECKVAIRNVRREFNDFIKAAKKDKLISENFFDRLTDITQQVTDKFTASADALATKKEKDIRSV